ncbi:MULTISPECIES: adenylyl-sulfate kinase [Pseudomonas]|jgi:adenylylsulfate kinase|uniref:Adenylyl-sulfate kinase n=1 Tax=Pseudomonas grimontii TaxID=129847 RepID=A0A1H1CDC3_9PSED|nr:adenylyl-sulfate kinase [Pseudomonas grimontii]MCS3512895.1 adenylylsulfate kinase [Pseudomonas grimontii]TWR69172.1 adenylyl-sulfate kinase [Pseudomonas grimontii]SDQ62185.1 adenylylsulfate kinase [Pseudomonas grimontii]
MSSQLLAGGCAAVRPFGLSLSAAARAALKHQQPCCLWLTGLSGSGKSTLANALEVHLNEQGRHTFVLDGDNLRTGLCNDLGMSDTARKENIRRIGEVARLMVDAGLIVIVSAISPFSVDRATARALFGPGQFFEVYISTPFDVCARRDPKGLYRAALDGRIKAFTGLDSPYEAPLAADCEINTDEVELAAAVEQILAVLFKK